jgi:uncharacterized membrane protein YeaQ/YmgE (transglycosylase-associated protein family)
MIFLLIIVFGAVAGSISFSINGSGYGLWWDVILGIVGAVIGCSVMAGAYIMNHFGRPDAIGFNWYSLTVATIGAIMAIYLTSMYKEQLRFNN